MMISMSLSLKITDNMKEAMKSKNSATLSTLRLLRSALKNKQIDVQHELNDEEVLGVVKTQVKQLKDGLDSFVSAGREDLAQAARAELVVLEAYLPAQMSDEQLEGIIKGVMEQTGAKSKQDMGKVMGIVMKTVADGADGARVKQMVERLLSVFIFMMIGMTTATFAHAAIDLVPVQLSQYSFLETGIRIFRVLLLWFGVLGINMILHGGFTFMVSSMRDETHKDCWGKIARGVISCVAVVLLYSVATIVIEII
jgi:uncharacterized protein YqeY